MDHAIIGFGKIGQALAGAFARRGMEVAVASTRPPGAIAPLAQEIGRTVVAQSLQDALEAGTIFLAVPFAQHREVGRAMARWEGKTVVDATNAFGVDPGELGGLASSLAVARALPGARLVKAFNHLPAEILARDPDVKGGRRVVFLSSDDAGAMDAVATLAGQLGFAPVKLGGLAEGGTLVQARGRVWAPLIFQDLVKFD